MPPRDALPPLTCRSKRIVPSANALSRGATSDVSESARIASITISSTFGLDVRLAHDSGVSGYRNTAPAARSAAAASPWART